MAKIVTIKLLIDSDDEGEVADFCAETFRDMNLVLDWGHTVVGPYEDFKFDINTYLEGDFLVTK